MDLSQISHTREEQRLGNVESINCLSSSAFSSKYLPTDLRLGTIDGLSYGIDFSYAADLSKTDFIACFKLLELTSSAAYRSSSRGWKPKAKKREMSEKDMRYLLIKQLRTPQHAPLRDGTSNALGDAPAEGFLSFMITEEDDYEVLYIYEVHLSPSLRRNGIGQRLMQFVERVASKVGLEKVMLTVFTSNEVAERFYRKIGYTDDEYSPAPKRLRNGIVKRPDYIIMSKEVCDIAQMRTFSV